MMELHVCNRNGTLLKAYALGDHPEVIVGRDESCDIRILARTVSREHCAIEVEGDHVVLRDLGSTSGTYVDGNKVETIPLQNGMEVTVGPAVLKYYENGI